MKKVSAATIVKYPKLEDKGTFTFKINDLVIAVEINRMLNFGDQMNFVEDVVSEVISKKGYNPEILEYVYRKSVLQYFGLQIFR